MGNCANTKTKTVSRACSKRLVLSYGAITELFAFFDELTVL